jgi:hypothetical protein
MNLFKYEGYKVNISPEAMMLKPFKEIYDRDKSKSKDKAFLELAYIYFYCDPRSDYQYIIDPIDKDKAIREGLDLLKWKPDKKITEAIEFYNSFKSTSSLLLEDTRIAVDKLRQMLKDIDLNQVDDKGKPVYTLNVITSTIKQVPSLAKDLAEAEKACTQDFIENTKMRGDKSKTLLEDGF